MLNLRKLGAQTAKTITPANDSIREISYLDVKDLYDSAYAQISNQSTNIFQTALNRADMLGKAYLAQLDFNEKNRYKLAA